MRAPEIAAALILGLSACQEPFGASRRDLLGFRIAAVTAAREGEQVRLGVAMVVDGRPWSHEPVALRWYAIADPTPAAVTTIPWEAATIAEGPAPLIADHDGQIAVIARHETSEARAIVTLPAPGVPVVGVQAIEARALPWTLSTVEAAMLGIDARAQVEAGAPVDAVSPDGFVRLRAAADAGALVRWMHTAPGGTFLELDPTTADWAAGALRFDEDDVEEARDGLVGARTVLALALPEGRDGANAWVARELWVGPPPVGLWTPGGRFLPSDRAIEGPWVRATLVADDLAPAGVSLVDLAPASADDDPGTAALPCRTPVEGPFDPDWLLAQRCARADVVGARVIVETRR